MRHLDRDLVREIEFSMARSGRDCIVSAQQHYPDKSREYAFLNFGDASAAFAGVDNPITQVIGLGLDGPVTAEQLDCIEQFFFSRGATCALELSPYIDPSLMDLLRHRPYFLTEFSNVLLRDLEDRSLDPEISATIDVRPIKPGEARLYAEIIVSSFQDEIPASEDLFRALETFTHLPDTRSYLAFIGGRAAGGGSAGCHGTVGGMFGAGTLPEFRRRGVQSALLQARIAWLREQGARYAYVVTHPGTTSQRNIERFGFRPTYSRVKLTRDLP